LKRAREIWSRWRRSITGADGHPTPELLSAYHEDRLSPERDGEIQEHFVECPECPELVLDLDRFTAPEAAEAGRDELSDTWVDGAWRRLRSRLATEGRPARPRLRRLAGPVSAWSMAALLLPCTVVLWVRVDALGAEVRDLRAPQLNPPWRDVESPGVLRGGTPPPWEVEVPAAARQFLLVLHPASPPASLEPREYHLEIRTGAGEDVWSGPGLVRSGEGSFVVGVSRRLLPAGDYRLRVTAAAVGEEEPFEEEFPLRLKYL
jgi:anti-sigma factor RsiW